MKCPRCNTVSLRHAKTKQGVELDQCPQCKGILLPENKVLNFSRQPDSLAQALKMSLNKVTQSDLKSPKTGKAMHKLPLLGEKLVVYRCQASKSLWFDDGKLNLMGKVVFKNAPGTGASSSSKGIKVAQGATSSSILEEKTISKKTGSKSKSKRQKASPLPDLSKFAKMPFLVTYGTLFLFLGLLTYFKVVSLYLGIEIFAVIAIVQFFGATYLMDKSVDYFYSVDWVSTSDLPPHLNKFINAVCDKDGLAFPRVGLLPDGVPNAFSYGKNHQNARLILTKGLMNLLDEEEVQAVVAHEIGHIKSKELFLMTASQMIPFLLSALYHWLIIMPDSDYGKEDYSKVPSRLSFVLAYFVHLAYFVFQFMNIKFARARELHADQFAVEATKNPNALVTALGKIAFAMGGVDRQTRTQLWCATCKSALLPEQIWEDKCGVCSKPVSEREIKGDGRTTILEAVGAFGILDPVMARAFTASNYLSVSPWTHFNDGAQRQSMVNWVKWENENPWSTFFQSLSTHPLLALRFYYLSGQASDLGEDLICYVKNPPPEKVDASVKKQVRLMWAPGMLLGLFFILFCFPIKTAWLSPLLVMAGLALLIRAKGMYGNDDLFPLVKVEKIMKNKTATDFKPEPVKLVGSLLGVEEKKPFGSGEYILKDDTGPIILDQKLPHKTFEFMFGVLRGRDLLGDNARITGWFRRSPIPYVEVETLKIHDELHNNKALLAQKVAGWILVIYGLIQFSYLFG